MSRWTDAVTPGAYCALAFPDNNVAVRFALDQGHWVRKNSEYRDIVNHGEQMILVDGDGEMMPDHTFKLTRVGITYEWIPQS